MKTEAQARAQKRYREARTQFVLTIPKAQKEAWKAHAEAQGMSLTSYICKLMEDDMKKSMDE